MPLAPKDMDRLILAINRNTAAQLAVAAMAAQQGKPSPTPTLVIKAAVRSTYADFLKELQPPS